MRATALLPLLAILALLAARGVVCDDPADTGDDAAAVNSRDRVARLDSELAGQEEHTARRYAERVPKTARVGLPNCASFPFCERIPAPPPQVLGPVHREMPFQNIPGIDNIPQQDHPFDHVGPPDTSRPRPETPGVHGDRPGDDGRTPGYTPGHTGGDTPDHHTGGGDDGRTPGYTPGHTGGDTPDHHTGGDTPDHHTGGDTPDHDWGNDGTGGDPDHHTDIPHVPGWTPPHDGGGDLPGHEAAECSCPSEDAYQRVRAAGGLCSELIDALPDAECKAACEGRQLFQHYCVFEGKDTAEACGCPTASHLALALKDGDSGACEKLLDALSYSPPCRETCGKTDAWNEAGCGQTHCECPSEDELRAERAAMRPCAGLLGSLSDECREVCHGKPEWEAAGCAALAPTDNGDLDSCACPGADDLRAARAAGQTCGSALVLLSAECRPHCASRPAWQEASCEPYSGDAQPSPDVTIGDGAGAGAGVLPPHEAPHDSHCRAPHAADFRFALAEKHTCLHLLHGLNLSPDCVLEIGNSPEWKQAGCEAFEGGPAHTHSLDAGAAADQEHSAAGAHHVGGDADRPVPEFNGDDDDGAAAAAADTAAPHAADAHATAAAGDGPEGCRCPAVELETGHTCADALASAGLEGECAKHCEKQPAYAECEKKQRERDGEEEPCVCPDLARLQALRQVGQPCDTLLASLRPACASKCRASDAWTGAKCDEEEPGAGAATATATATAAATPDPVNDAGDTPVEVAAEPEQGQEQGQQECFCPDADSLKSSKEDGHSCDDVLAALSLPEACVQQCRANEDWKLAACGDAPSAPASATTNKEECACPSANEYKAAVAAGSSCADLHLSKGLRIECAEACSMGEQFKEGGCVPPPVTADDGSNAGRACCKRKTIVVHESGEGEHASDLAHHYCTTVAELRGLNPGLPEAGKVPAGERVTVPPPINCGDGREPLGVTQRRELERQAERCTCPPAADYVRALARGEKCVAVLESSGATGSCAQRCTSEGAWSESGCGEAPTAAAAAAAADEEKVDVSNKPTTDKPATTATAVDKPAAEGAACSCPSKAAFEAAAKKDGGSCGDALQGATPECRVHCSGLKAWTDAQCGAALTAAAQSDHAPGTRMAGSGGHGDPNVPLMPDSCSRATPLHYTVREGDFALRIARSTCAALGDVKKANPSQDLDDLHVGSTLVVPLPCSCPSQESLREALGAGKTCADALAAGGAAAARTEGCTAECRARQAWSLAGCSSPAAVSSGAAAAATDVEAAQDTCSCPGASVYWQLQRRSKPCSDALKTMSAECQTKCKTERSWSTGGCQSAPAQLTNPARTVV